MPVRVRHATAMPMDMDMPRKHGGVAAQRCVERVIGRFRTGAMSLGMFVIIAVAMIVLGELGL